MIYATLLLLLLQLPTLAHGQNSIYAELKNELSSNRSRTGQRVTMVVLEDVRAEDGTVAIPARAKLTGQVTIATKHSRGNPAALAFVLQSASWKGRTVDLHTNIANLELMRNQKYISANLPDPLCNPYPMASGNSADDPQVPAASCGVEKIGSDDEPAIVCHGREVVLGPGARMYLAILRPH